MVSCTRNTGITSQDPEILQHHSLTSLFTAFFKPDIPLEPLLLSLYRSNSTDVGALKFPLSLLIPPCECACECACDDDKSELWNPPTEAEAFVERSISLYSHDEGGDVPLGCSESERFRAGATTA